MTKQMCKQIRQESWAQVRRQVEVRIYAQVRLQLHRQLTRDRPIEAAQW